jgi:hypothetical protein
MRVATLAFSSRNTAELAALLDGKNVRSLSLLCSDFFAKHNRAEFTEAHQELVVRRGQRLAAPRCHAKVVTLDFDDGRKLVFEGSANLRTNGNVEQFALLADDALHDWHAGWQDDMMARWHAAGGKGSAAQKDEAPDGRPQGE